MLLASLFKNVSIMIGAGIMYMNHQFTGFVWLLLLLVAVSALTHGRTAILFYKKIFHTIFAVAVPMIPLFLSHSLPWNHWPQLIVVMATASFSYVMFPDVVSLWKNKKWFGYRLLVKIEREIEEGGDHK